MTTDASVDFGMIGLAVMGRNLSLNILDHDFTVAGWNLEPEATDALVTESEGRLVGTKTYEEFLACLKRPRRIMMMIKAGKPVDIVLGQLKPLLAPGDIVIDGGNSWFEDTRRREKEMAEAGFRFFGIGVSGGEDGARFGPSLMPGGDPAGYKELEPILTAIAAKTDSGPCVTHCGPNGAGHFVKMVHNGIEYADMQFIAEAYHLLHLLGGAKPPQLAETFSAWNEGPLESFLIEITAQIFAVRDVKTDGWLIDQVLDKAGQKGTGRWTAQVALNLGVSIPSIAAAIDARVLSSMKKERAVASPLLAAGTADAATHDLAELTASVRDALEAAKVIAYAQGMALIGAGSRNYDWNVDLSEMARIWKGGCIIRARLLDDIMRAYQRDAGLVNLILDEAFRTRIAPLIPALRKVVGLGLSHGVAIPGMSASLAYYDAYRSTDLPQNLTQAQRDAFGAHTYQRKDDADGTFVHTDWLD